MAESLEQSESLAAPPISSEYDQIPYTPITDGPNDIAKSFDLDGMRVELPGRQPLQRIWLWAGSDSASANSRTKYAALTNKSYKPEEDGPGGWETTEQWPTLPTTTELQPAADAVEYLEIGLVLGDDPQQMRNPKRGKGRQRNSTALISRDVHVVRAVTPVSALKEGEMRYYVACRPEEGRCWQRVIHGDYVFFYPEFWQGLPAKASRRRRMDHISNRIKLLRTSNPTTYDHQTETSTSLDGEGLDDAKVATSSYKDEAATSENDV